MKANRWFVVGLLLVVAMPLAERVQAEGMPEHVRKTLDRLVGKWNAEDVVNGKVIASELECEWSPDKSTLTYQFRNPQLANNLATFGFGILGWDGSASLVRESGFGSDGTTFEATHSIAPAANEWKSPTSGTVMVGGKLVKASSSRIAHWNNDDEWILTSTNRKVDGKNEADTKTTFRRAKSAAAQYLDYFKPTVGTWKSRAVIDGKTVESIDRWDLSAMKTCLVSTSTGGGGTPAGQGIEGYDAALGAWKSVGFNEAGESSTLIVHISNMHDLKPVQAGAKGTYETYRTLANGTTQIDRGDWIFPSWDAKQHVLKLTNVTKNGQPQPDLTIHYERQ